MTRNYKFIPYKKIIEFESQKLKTTTKLEKKSANDPKQNPKAQKLWGQSVQ